MNRRSFLHAGLAGAALASLARPLGATPPAEQRRARNVIFVVSDGMSLGALTLAELHLRRHASRRSHWLSLLDRPDIRRALVDTASANSPVTDSAAASSAWGSGVRVNNGAINIAPDGTPLTPLIPLARAGGLATGLATTATITHATPAGFAVNIDARGREDEIARLYLEVDVDVLLGGGRRFFDPHLRADGRDVAADFSAAGRTVVRDRDALTGAPVGPLLGLFSDGHLPYAIDRRADATLAASTPTLADLTTAALRQLTPAADNGRGFLLQVEGARIDHAAHANDVAGLVHDQIDLDEALAVVLRFAATRDDTLVIVTSDHGNSNPGLNGTGSAYTESLAAFERLARFRQTNVWTLSGLDADSTAAAVRDRVEAASDLRLTTDEIEIVRRALRREHREGYRVREDALVALAQVMANHVSVGWTGVSHTADFAELLAFGPGAEAVGGFMRNTDVHHVVRRALGLAG